MEISCFKQRDGDSFSTTWKKFNALLRKCPYHGFTDLQQIHILFNGLSHNAKGFLNASVSGSLRKKGAEEARELIEIMANEDEASGDL